MGIWCDWEAQGTRLTQNLLHDNQRPEFAKPLKGGMMSQDIFVEVSHGPTLIDNNILLSDVSMRFATQGVAMVHNLICGSLSCVGGGTAPRYTPYHIPHRTEVCGFMTFLHGDDRFYNNIFLQKWSPEDFITLHDCDEGFDVEKEDGYYLDTNLYEYLGEFKDRMITTQVLGKAFEPEQYFENPDETPITFNEDYFGSHRGLDVIPGPFASADDARKAIGKVAQ